MADKLTIEMNSDDKKILLQAMQNGLDRFKEHITVNRTITNIGATGTKWDMINSECKDALSDKRYDIVVCKRGVWQLVLIYDKETKALYTLMKEKRFEELSKLVRKDKVHYLEAITTVNKWLAGEEIEQLALFDDFNKLKAEKIDKTVEQLLKNIDGEVRKHVLIAFTEKNLELYSISALIVTPSLQVLHKENWGEYIQPKYLLDISNEDINNEDEEEIALGLKVTKEKIDNIKLKRKKEKRNNM